MRATWFKTLPQDCLHFWVLATTALCLGLLINQFRDTPLPLTYQSKKQRLDDAVVQLADASPKAASPEATNTSAVETLPEEVSLTEFQQIVTQKKAKVFDARPEIFH